MSVQNSDGLLKDGTWIRQIRSYYTPSQAVQWLSRIGVNLGITQDEIEAGSVPTSLETLNLLRKDRAYSGAARVNEAPLNETPIYGNLSHQVIFVQPIPDSNRTYLVDVGFGVPGLARPILLSSADDNVIMGVDKTEKHRLTQSSIPSSSLGQCTKRLQRDQWQLIIHFYLVCVTETLHNSGESPEIKWNLEVYHEKKTSPDEEGWRIMFTFSEEEFFFEDYAAASFVVSMMPNPRGFFWNNVVCVKHFVLDPVAQVIGLNVDQDTDTEKPMYRLVMVGKEVKQNIGGETKIIRTMKNEQERIQILRDLFGVHVKDMDAAHIAGRQPAF
ncbi:hypothetical protein CVT24_010750 [Panaeolus cyanescens]|uniref:Uncharacterized protein n=1 Tax=Panaeolus cyanescens TaxID=181874 RepID=A0A409YME6_9AGAR|nr:hypothetical protein CVT24_010750 [Panaeolus cyanescens]